MNFINNSRTQAFGPFHWCPDRILTLNRQVFNSSETSNQARPNTLASWSLPQPNHVPVAIVSTSRCLSYTAASSYTTRWRRRYRRVIRISLPIVQRCPPSKNFSTMILNTGPSSFAEKKRPKRGQRRLCGQYTLYKVPRKRSQECLEYVR
jgi:hypothetical protein